MKPATPAPAAQPQSLSDLFWSFNRLALQGFGGVLAVVQRELVEEKKWLTPEEFLPLRNFRRRPISRTTLAAMSPLAPCMVRLWK